MIVSKNALKYMFLKRFYHLAIRTICFRECRTYKAFFRTQSCTLYNLYALGSLSPFPIPNFRFLPFSKTFIDISYDLFHCTLSFFVSAGQRLNSECLTRHLNNLRKETEFLKVKFYKSSNSSGPFKFIAWKQICYIGDCFLNLKASFNF